MSSHIPPGEQERQQVRLMLQTALMGSLSIEKRQWLSDQLSLIAIEKSNRSVDMAFGLCSRRLGGQPVPLNNIQQRELHQHMPGWKINNLPAETIARILFITCFSDARQLAEQLTRLLRHANLKEQLALYKGLPLFPASAVLNDRLTDGLRSNTRDVFEAIAHDNPYAAWHLDTHRFNHMVLKALFINCELASIVGLEPRNNPELAHMLLDAARECRAASRPISDELWTLAAPHMTREEREEFDLKNAA